MFVDKTQADEVIIEDAYTLFLAETESLLNQAEYLMRHCNCQDDMTEIAAIVDVMRLMMEIAAIIYAADNALIDLSLTTRLSKSVLSSIAYDKNAVGVEHIQKLKMIRQVLKLDLRAHHYATRH